MKRCFDCQHDFEMIIMEPLWDESYREVRWVCPDCLDEYYERVDANAT